MNKTERIAGSVVVSLVGGFLVVVTLVTNVERAFIIWMLTVICCGLVIGRINNFTVKAVLEQAIIPALILSVIPPLVFYFEFVIAKIRGLGEQGLFPWGASFINPLDPGVIK